MFKWLWKWLATHGEPAKESRELRDIRKRDEETNK